MTKTDINHTLEARKTGHTIEESARWEERYADLTEFKEEHNHCRVPQRYVNKQLAQWVAEQRKLKNKMSEERKSKLEALGFDWKPYKTSWSKRYAELIEFKAKYKHCRVPKLYANKQLAHWVAVQRNSKNKMSEERKSKLEALGFDWEPYKTSWSKRYEELIEFKQQHSHCLIPYVYPSNQKLAFWVHAQRASLETLSKEKKDKLNALGFVWDSMDYIWDVRYNELIIFKSQHGHCNCTPANTENQKLVNWISTQRSFKDKLSEEKKNMLDAIGFDWNREVNKWEEKYEELVLFKTQHGTCRVPQGRPPYTQLGDWVRTQRKSKNTLSEEKKNMLDELGFAWNPMDTRWEENYEKLVQYKAENEHCSSPEDIENNQLRQWVYHQKRSIKTLNKERKDKLESFDFNWDARYSRAPRDSSEYGWDKRYDELVKFKSQHGHCNCTHSNTENKKLLSWMNNQRALRKTMDEEKKNKLNAIGFVWKPAEHKWNEKYEELVLFKSQHGSCKVPLRQSPLGKWVDRQRRLKDTLSEEKIKKLNGIGFFED